MKYICVEEVDLDIHHSSTKLMQQTNNLLGSQLAVGRADKLKQSRRMVSTVPLQLPDA